MKKGKRGYVNRMERENDEEKQETEGEIAKRKKGCIRKGRVKEANEQEKKKQGKG